MTAHDLPIHLVRRGTTPAMLVLLHGYGSNEDDLFGLADAFAPTITVVSLRAPLPLMPGAYAWFALDFVETGIAMDVPGAHRALERLQRDLAALAHAYAAERVFVLGFSQGAGMAAAAALALPDLVAGGVLLSGITPAVLNLTLPAASAQTFFVAHGMLDPVVPLASGRSTRDLLNALGATLVYREYPMGHTIGEACLRDLVAWVDSTVVAPRS